MSISQGPNKLALERLTEAEKGAMLEHVFYHMRFDIRSVLMRTFPDAYARLMNMPFATVLDAVVENESRAEAARTTAEPVPS